jgi:lambda repressor-like predicted transcriptional regulator
MTTTTAEAREHVAQLLNRGVTIPAIVATAGVSERTLYSVLHLTNRTIKNGTAEALRSIPTNTASSSGLVPALDTKRRLQALIAYGYTLTDIAQRSGLALSGLVNIAYGKQVNVEAGTRNRVADIYEKLSTTPGPCDAARKQGRDNRWRVPAAWDDIDDPREEPAPHIPDARTLVNRVLTGDAHINLLSSGQEVNLWRRWADESQAVDIEPSDRAFARRFRISARRAARIRSAATRASSNSNQRKVA